MSNSIKDRLDAFKNDNFSDYYDDYSSECREAYNDCARLLIPLLITAYEALDNIGDLSAQGDIHGNTICGLCDKAINQIDEAIDGKD